MITVKEYLDAIDIVEQYHKQVKKRVKLSKQKINDWLEENESNFEYKSDGTDRRVYNSLRFAYQDDDPRRHIEYIEDVDKRKFLRLRNVGKTCWERFVEIRGY